MGMLTRLASGVAVVATALMAWPAAASAAPDQGELGLDIRTVQPAYRPGEPARLTFAVTNTTGAACALAKAAEGTVRVLSVQRDGQELVPALGRSFYLDGIERAIAASMVTAPPGSTVDIGLTAVRVDDGADAGSVVLRSVAVNADGGGLDTLWPVGTPGRYEVTASYAVGQVGGATTPCGGATATRIVAFSVGDVDSGLPWPWLLGAAVLVLAAGVVAVVVLTRRRSRTATAAVLVLVGLRRP